MPLCMMHQFIRHFLYVQVVLHLLPDLHPRLQTIRQDVLQELLINPQKAAIKLVITEDIWLRENTIGRPSCYLRLADGTGLKRISVQLLWSILPMVFSQWLDIELTERASNWITELLLHGLTLACQDTNGSINSCASFAGYPLIRCHIMIDTASLWFQWNVNWPARCHLS